MDCLWGGDIEKSLCNVVTNMCAASTLCDLLDDRFNELPERVEGESEEDSLCASDLGEESEGRVGENLLLDVQLSGGQLDAKLGVRGWIVDDSVGCVVTGSEAAGDVLDLLLLRERDLHVEILQYQQLLDTGAERDRLVTPDVVLGSAANNLAEAGCDALLEAVLGIFNAGLVLVRSVHPDMAGSSHPEDVSVAGHVLLQDVLDVRDCQGVDCR